MPTGKYHTHLISKPQVSDSKYFGDVNTQGIIEAVLYGDERCKEYTTAFAPTLKGAKVFDTCRNIWEFLKSEIPYVLDKSGYQFIKSPGRLWQDKAGDCKSFSVFTASLLKNLGIPYGYRFTSYNPGDNTPTHVYVYVPVKGGAEIIIDAVWSGPFNTQKPYSFKQDYKRTSGVAIGSVGNNKKFVDAFNSATHK